MSRASFHLSQVLLTLSAGAMAAATIGGCAEHGRMAIPGNADRLVGGAGRKITSVVAPHPGRIYVLDRDKDSVLWSGDVHAGQMLVIDGVARKVLLDERPVSSGVARKDYYVVFLSKPK